MQIIYADTLFLVNWVLNYFLLLAAARICAPEAKRLRLALGAALGAGYALAAALGPPFLQNGFCKLGFAALMLLATFGFHRLFARLYLVFLAVSAAFGGAVWALFGKSEAGGAVIAVPFRVLVLAFAVCYVLVSAVFRLTGRSSGADFARLELTQNGKTVSLRALRDTGHSLTDPLTLDDVAIIEGQTAAALFSGEAAQILRTLPRFPGAADALESLNSTGHSFYLLPYSAVGVEMALLLAFRPERIRIDGCEQSHWVVAISPTALSPDGSYSAILGGSV